MNSALSIPGTAYSCSARTRPEFTCFTAAERRPQSLGTTATHSPRSFPPRPRSAGPRFTDFCGSPVIHTGFPGHFIGGSPSSPLNLLPGLAHKVKRHTPSSPSSHTRARKHPPASRGASITCGCSPGVCSEAGVPGSTSPPSLSPGGPGSPGRSVQPPSPRSPAIPCWPRLGLR